MGSEVELREALILVLEAGFVIEKRGDGDREGMTLYGSRDGTPLLQSDPTALFAVKDPEWIHDPVFPSAAKAVDHFLAARRRGEEGGWEPLMWMEEMVVAVGAEGQILWVEP